jgi:hypothetical protein
MFSFNPIDGRMCLGSDKNVPIQPGKAPERTTGSTPRFAQTDGGRNNRRAPLRWGLSEGVLSRRVSGSQQKPVHFHLPDRVADWPRSVKRKGCRRRAEDAWSPHDNIEPVAQPVYPVRAFKKGPCKRFPGQRYVHVCASPDDDRLRVIAAGAGQTGQQSKGDGS